MCRVLTTLFIVLVMTTTSRYSSAQSDNAHNTFTALSTRPTFDCTGATTATARVICLNQAGAKADWDLNSAFWARHFSLSEEERDEFDEADERWRDSLGQTCRIGPHQSTFLPSE